MKKRLLCTLLLVVFLLGSLSTFSFAKTVISSVSISDLDEPVVGETPDTTFSVSGEGYRPYAVDWYDETAGDYIEETDRFIAGHQYTALVMVGIEDGYVFSHEDDNTPTVTATLNGTNAKVAKAYGHNAWAVIEVQHTFSPLPSITTISYIDLTIPAPVVGEKPTFNKVEADGFYSDNNGNPVAIYKNGIAWYKTSYSYVAPGTTETFKAGTDYTLKVSLLAKEGYSFPADLVAKVNGKTATVTAFDEIFIVVEYVFSIPSDHDHTPSPWCYTLLSHYKSCTTCGDYLEQEAHYGGTATCSALAVCDGCGFSYGEVSEEHFWESGWEYRDATGHAAVCSECGTHDTPISHTPGPEATDTTPQTCTVCSYIITPVLNHTHEMQKTEAKEATCTQPGNTAYYTCSGCSLWFADAEGKTEITNPDLTVLPPAGHKVSNDWKYDEIYHWNSCSVCGEVLDETKFPHTDVDSNGTCDSCPYVIGSGETNQDISLPVPEATVPTDTETEKEPTPESRLPWGLIAVIGVVCAAAIAVVIVLLIKRKK